MRWRGKVCPLCGGDLYADYADISLACLECGYHEPPPRPSRARAGPSAKQPSLRDSRVPAEPLVALVEVRPGSQRLLEAVCVAHGRQVVCLSSAPCSNEEVALAAAELCVIEADRGGLAVALARRLRAQAPAVPIAVVLTCWSESELEGQSAAEFVMHAPLREDEVNKLLEIVESYSGWLPSPLLAATYRARVTD